MRNILFVVIFSTFSLYAKNLIPLTHEEVKHFRVLNAPTIRATRGTSIYDAIGIFRLCEQELGARNTGCVCSMGDRIEYFLRLGAAVSLGIGFDAGILRAPMNSAEAGVFKGLARVIGNHLQRATDLVALADASHERTHLQGFDRHLRTGTLRGQHTIDLSGVSAEKSNAALRAKLARDYADLPRVSTYDQPFEVALLARVISANPAYSGVLQRFFTDTDLPLRPRVSLLGHAFLSFLEEIRAMHISNDDLISCLEILRDEDNEEKILNMFRALGMLRAHATARALPFDAAMAASIFRKLSRMSPRMCTELERVMTALPGVSPIHLPDFSGYISMYASDKQPAVIEVIRNAMVDNSADNVDAVKKILTQRPLIGIPRTLLGQVLPKFIQMVKSADNKPSMIDALNRLVGLGLLGKLPAAQLAQQIDQFAAILQTEAIVLPEDFENADDAAAVRRQKQAIRVEKVSAFRKRLGLFLEEPEGGFDDVTGEAIEVDDPFAADRDVRFALITGLASLRVSGAAKVKIINRVYDLENVRGFTINDNKLNAVDMLSALGQQTDQIVDIIMQVFQLPDAHAGLEPVANLVDRFIDRVLLNDRLPNEFRYEHSHLDFALTLLNSPVGVQTDAIAQYIADPHTVMAQARLERERRARGGQPAAVVVDAGLNAGNRHAAAGCMAVHYVSALVCDPLERALNHVNGATAIPSTAAARVTLAQWIEAFGTDGGRVLTRAEAEDVAATKIRLRAVLERANSAGYAYTDMFERYLPKVVAYIGKKGKAKKDTWLINSLGEASQAYDRGSVGGNLSCDKGIAERLVLGLKYQDQPEFDNILGIIDLGDMVTGKFNTMQVLKSPGVDERGKRVEASELWKLWEKPHFRTRALPRSPAEAVEIWEQAIDAMQAETMERVMGLLRASHRFLGGAYQPLLDNYEGHVNGTADRIKRDWRTGIAGLFVRFQDIKAGRV